MIFVTKREERKEREEIIKILEKIKMNFYYEMTSEKLKRICDKPCDQNKIDKLKNQMNIVSNLLCDVKLKKEKMSKILIRLNDLIIEKNYFELN